MGVLQRADDMIKEEVADLKGARPADSKIEEVLRVNMGAPSWLTRTFLEDGGYMKTLFSLLVPIMTPLLKLLFFLVNCIPGRFRHTVTIKAFKLWLALHRRLPPWVVRRGMSDNMSLEAHSLHNILWWARIIPCPIFGMRFGLSQLGNNFPSSAPVEYHDSKHTPGLRSGYVKILPDSVPKEKRPVLLWAFGGAYVSGDVAGNVPVAEHYGRTMNCDVFVVDMRLCPEYQVTDAVLDLYRGYLWLLERVPAENILMLGISSGGGAVLRVCQLARASQQEREEYFGSERGEVPPGAPQPAGAILLGPFVKYTKVEGSMLDNCKYDLIVSPRVLEAILPSRCVMAGGEDRLVICSPLAQTMEGLPPLMISVSEHECLIDEDLLLAEKAQAAKVDVELSTRPYMPHVYQMLSPFVPEAAEEEQKIFDWMRRRGGIWANKEAKKTTEEVKEEKEARKEEEEEEKANKGEEEEKKEEGEQSKQQQQQQQQQEAAQKAKTKAKGGKAKATAAKK